MEVYPQARGKPAIAGPGEYRSLRFNLTHTEGLVACAVTRTGEIGIDAEQTSRGVDTTQVGEYFLSPPEQLRLAELSGQQRTNYFFERWVLKEAYLEGRGTGFSQSPARFCIELSDQGLPSPIGNWRLSLHRPTARHVAAVAVRMKRSRDSISIKWLSARRLIEAGIAVEGRGVPDIGSL